MAENPSLVAVGRLPALGERWAGLLNGPAGPRLVYGSPDDEALLLSDPGDRRQLRRELLALVAMYLDEEVGEAPGAFEATHEDVAGVLRWLVASEADPVSQPLLHQALDGLDDGLAADEVLRRVTRAAAANEQADLIDLLVQRYRELRG